MIFVARTLAFMVGFLSLSQEILWIRLGSFIQRGIPESFAFILGIFLVGISAGALFGKKLCTQKINQCHWIGWILLISGSFDLMIPWLTEALSDGMSFIVLGMLVLISSALKATAFPVAHHLGSDVNNTGQLGRSVSRVYALNIIGSTLGALLTGYFLLDHVSLSGGFVLIGAMTLTIGAIALQRTSPPLSALSLIAAIATLLHCDLNSHDMPIAAGGYMKQFITRVIENRHGIIHTVKGGMWGDIVYGGNAYDGRTSIDLRLNGNMVDRVYLLAKLHPSPRRILVIGLSAGAWTRILSSMPATQRIDTIEINPGYIELISHYPHLAPILEDPRIKIHIDDGRRWLRRHPAEKYDLIVMNSTWHWRANVTNLLSREFHQLVKEHLTPGGLFAFNTTGSDDAIATAAENFPYVFKWSNFVYASDHDFTDVPHDVALSRLTALHLGGKPIFDAAAKLDREALDKLVNAKFITIAEVRNQSSRQLEIITDTNMITEFKYGKHMRLN